MQVGVGGYQEGGADNPGILNARIINMLRGGILYVKIRKGMELEGGEDGLPSSGRQVLLRLRSFTFAGGSPTFLPAQRLDDCTTACQVALLIQSGTLNSTL